MHQCGNKLRPQWTNFVRQLSSWWNLVWPMSVHNKNISVQSEFQITRISSVWVQSNSSHHCQSGLGCSKPDDVPLITVATPHSKSVPRFESQGDEASCHKVGLWGGKENKIMVSLYVSKWKTQGNSCKTQQQWESNPHTCSSQGTSSLKTM